MLVFSGVFSFFHCGFRIRYFHCLKHRNNFMHNFVMGRWIDSFSCNVVFMIFMQSSSQTLPPRFVGFNDACIFRFASARRATSLAVFASPDLARHGCWDRNFQLFPHVYHGSFDLCICRINERNTSQFSGIIELWFLTAHFCFSLRWRCV